MGHLGFSYVGLVFLLMLMVPNLVWTKHKPVDYNSQGENKVLLAFERVGQVCVTCTSLMFSNFNIHGWSIWNLWLIMSGLLMILYELWWVRYFKSKKNMKDFYSSLFAIPVSGATLPVAAFFLLVDIRKSNLANDFSCNFGNWPYRYSFAVPKRNFITLSLK